jgi:hypothetical protein
VKPYGRGAVSVSILKARRLADISRTLFPR